MQKSQIEGSSALRVGPDVRVGLQKPEPQDNTFVSDPLGRPTVRDVLRVALL